MYSVNCPLGCPYQSVTHRRALNLAELIICQLKSLSIWQLHVRCDMTCDLFLVMELQLLCFSSSARMTLNHRESSPNLIIMPDPDPVVHPVALSRSLALLPSPKFHNTRCGCLGRWPPLCVWMDRLDPVAVYIVYRLGMNRGRRSRSGSGLPPPTNNTAQRAHKEKKRTCPRPGR